MDVKGAFETQYAWLKGYNGQIFTDDVLAAIVVTILLVPQCLAYALLAGLPPQLGIYASIFPLIAYVLLGSSNYLNVGPTAVISLMTAAAIAALPPETRVASAGALALLTGGMLIVAGLLKAGFIMNFVSRPVVSAYITGAALLIIFSQAKHVLGVSVDSQTAFGMVYNLLSQASEAKPLAFITGASAIFLFVLARGALPYLFVKSGVRAKIAKLISRMAPIVIIVAFVLISGYLDFGGKGGLAIVGDVPAGLPPWELPNVSVPAYENLLIPALVIAIVAFVDSTSTAQELASRKRSRVDTNKELLGIGAANAVAGLSAGYPINGSMSRSAVNFSAGGKTPLVGLMVAAFMALTAVFLTPILYNLPLSVLAALIIVACLNLLDFRSLWRTWMYSRADGMTALATFFAVLILGVQWGVLAGVVLAMSLHIRRSLTPHMPLVCLLYTSPSPRDATLSRMPSSA